MPDSTNERMESLNQLMLADARNRLSQEDAVECIKITDYYEGHCFDEDYLEDDFRNPAEPVEVWNARKKFMTQLNVTKDILDKKAYLFKSPPSIDIYEGVSDRVTQIITDHFSKSQFANLRLLDLWSRAHGNSFGILGWDKTNGVPAVTYWTREQVSLYENAENPTVADAYGTCRYITNTVEGVSKQHTIAFVYTPETIRKYYDGTEVDQPSNPDGLNPWGIMPVVNIKTMPTWDSCWSSGIGEALIDSHRIIADALSELVYLVKMQAHGQPVAKGAVDIPGIGPNLIIECQADGSFTFENANADIAGSISALTFELTALYASSGLRSEDPFRINIDAASGVAILISKTDILEDREERAVLWEEYLREMIQKMAVIATYELEGKLIKPETVQVDIEFPAVSLPVPTQEKILTEQHELATNQTNPVKLFQAKNAGYDDDEAYAAVLDNMTINQQLASDAALATAELKRRTNPQQETAEVKETGDIWVDDPRAKAGGYWRKRKQSYEAELPVDEEGTPAE